MAKHADLTSIHLFAYIQDADPGAVGAGKAWVDTTGATNVLKIRNAADTGWEAIDLTTVADHNHDADYAALVHAHTTGDITDLAEYIRDTIGTARLEGANIDLTVNDAGDTITVAVTGIDAELIRDTIAAAFVGGAGIAIAVDDPGDSITASLDI